MIPKVLFIPLCTISSWEHNELRLALRSWQRFGPEIETLLIIGYKPDWLINVHHIPFIDRWSKPVNIFEKVKIAATHYKEFIFANDDHFLLKPLIDLPYYYSGTLFDFKGGGETFMRYVQNTWQKYPQGKYFDVHTPMIVKAQVVNRITYTKDILFKSAYCNEAKIEGVEFRDCKVTGHMRTPDIEAFAMTNPFLSTGEVLSVDLKKWLFEKFPEKSRFEK